MTTGFQPRRRTQSPDEWERSAPVGGTGGSAALAVVQPSPDGFPAPVSRAKARQTLLAKRVWEHLDPNDDPTRGVHIRLNAYELAIFQAACEVEDKAQQRVSRRLIRAWSEEQLGIKPIPTQRERFAKKAKASKQRASNPYDSDPNVTESDDPHSLHTEDDQTI